MSLRHETLASYHNVLARVTEFIESNYANPDLEMADFYRHAGYSRRSVQRSLAFHNTSWREILTEVRMVKASELLVQYDYMYVSSVAKAVGFKQPAQFAKAFRKRTAMSPTEYRNHFRAHPKAA